MSRRLYSRRRPFGLCLALGLFLLAAGCGKSHGTISGKVTYKGQPLKGGQVTFISDQGGGGQANISEEDGSYTMEKVPIGPGTFAVQPPMMGPPPMMPGSAAPAKGMELPSDLDPSVFHRGGGRSLSLPDKYTDPQTSGLQFTVTGGAQQHNIELP